MPCCTSDNSVTIPAESIKNLDADLQLKTIARSSQLWDKLIEYTRIVSEGISSRTHTLPEKMKPSTDLPFPPVEEQEQAARISQAWHHYNSLLAQDGIAVTCELAIQDEISHSLCTPLNYGLRVRISFPDVMEFLHNLVNRCDTAMPPKISQSMSKKRIQTERGGTRRMSSKMLRRMFFFPLSQTLLQRCISSK